MKKIIAIICALSVSSVLAQQNAEPSHGEGSDRLEIVGLENMPIPVPPSEAVKMKNTVSVRSVDGFSSDELSPDTVQSFFNSFTTAKTFASNSGPGASPQRRTSPTAYKNLSDLSLTFQAGRVPMGKLVAVAPSGTMIGQKWTGVERFFEIDGGGRMRLTEFDMGATDGKFFMLKEAINARVHGKAAISKVFRDASGQTVEEVLWVNGHMLNILSYSPKVHENRQTNASARISAYSLVQQIR